MNDQIGAVIARAVAQASDYGCLMFTRAEFEVWHEATRHTPDAALAIGPGQIIPLRSLVIHVLPDL